jgi:two-component system, response regulator
MSHGQRYILLVEDDRDDEDLLLRTIEKAGAARVVVVRDGQEAVEYLHCTGAYASRDPAAQPAVVLLDLKMPKLDGAAVLRRLRADPRTVNLPVVVLTSSTEEVDIRECHEAGATSYVHKPVDYAEFESAVSRVAYYWSQLNLRPSGSRSP